MKTARIALLGLVILFGSCGPKEEQANENATARLAEQLVMATVWFQQSAEMEASYLQAYTWAKFLIDQKLDTLGEGNYGVVLDIDETVLDNSPYEVELIREGRTYQSDTWVRWTAQARARALPGALDFVKYAQSKGVEVFYISNRKLVELAPTLRNLDSLGFPFADEAHVLLKDDTSDKTPRREQVNEKVEVILYVGDQLTDYSEAFSGRTTDLGKGYVHATKEDWMFNFVILPNPTYGEWENALYEYNYALPDSVKVKRRLEILQD